MLKAEKNIPPEIFPFEVSKNGFAGTDSKEDVSILSVYFFRGLDL